jgi:hypothetical protein
LGCGGTYSNEDIAFQTAIPRTETVTPTVRGLLTQESAEYYRITHETTAAYASIVRAVMGILGGVREHQANLRLPQRRIWGPFPDETDARFQTRVDIRLVQDNGQERSTVHYALAMSREGTPLAADTEWIPLLTGTYAPGASSRSGSGELMIETGPLRAVGYSFGNDLRHLQKLTLRHTREERGRTLSAEHSRIESVEGDALRSSRLETTNEASGAGHVTFQLTMDSNLWVQEATILTRWNEEGAGRGDMRVTVGLASGMQGTDCWDARTRALYVHRDWDATAAFGQATNCAFAAPSEP